MVLNPGLRMELPGGAFKEICILDPSPPGVWLCCPGLEPGKLVFFSKLPDDSNLQPGLTA